MNQIVRLFAARPAFRYLALIAAMLLVGVLSWIGYLASDELSRVAIVPVAAYLLATPIWIIFAVLDRRRTIWRLLLTWAPEVAPVAWLVVVGVIGDSTGLAYLGVMTLIEVVGAACILGSVAALVYRPGEGPSRPTQ